jgi:uncharacterized oxidoreductase
METKGNTILITGATSGIGLAFAAEFHKLGNKVIICGRRQERLDELTKKYPGMISKACDVSLEIDRKDLFDWVQTEHPEVNILMNNAGVQFAFNLLQEVNHEKLSAEIATNLVAPIHLSSLFSAFLAKQKQSALINISSGLAFVPIAFMPVYCATKAAIHSFTLSLRYQLKNTPVKVFEIAPPSVDTELGHDRRTDKTQSHGGIPIGEFLAEAMEAIKNDLYEAPIGMAKGLRENREKAFEGMNDRIGAQ